MYILSSRDQNAMLSNNEEKSWFQTVNTPNSRLQRLKAGSSLAQTESLKEQKIAWENEKDRENVFIWFLQNKTAVSQVSLGNRS